MCREINDFGGHGRLSEAHRAHSRVSSWLDDPEAIAQQYASEEELRQRVLAHRELVDGPDDEEIVRERILAACPGRLLEVGSGLGELSGLGQVMPRRRDRRR